MRILFVSGEVSPFAKVSETADLVRTLPERLQELGDYETRIMMPRYGKVSERKNRLHEVIRLSGNPIPMGKDKETLKVKVASIPGIRLQVYFMDNTKYFKRKAYYADAEGKPFHDNPERALFFARAVIQTTRNLGWQPDVVHSFGWIAALVPMLLRTDFGADPLFEATKIIYSPDHTGIRPRFTPDQITRQGLGAYPRLAEMDLVDVGAAYADAVIHTREPAPSDEEALYLSTETPETMTEQAVSLYGQVLSEEEGSVVA